MTEFYTNVLKKGNNIIVRGRDDQGNATIKEVKFKPSLFVETSKQGDYLGVKGENLKKVSFDSISEAYQFTKSNSGISNFRVHGNDNWVHQYISESNVGSIKYNPKAIRVFNLDIEVQSGLYDPKHSIRVRDASGNITSHFMYELKNIPNSCQIQNEISKDWEPKKRSIYVTQASGGFPRPEEAKWPITLIGLKDSGVNRYKIFGYGNGDGVGYQRATHLKNIQAGDQHDLDPNTIDYIECTDENDMIMQFMAYWVTNMPDVYTGWNTEGFDTPYIYNRIVNRLGEDVVKKLSPIGKITSFEKEDKWGNVHTKYNIQGVSQIDYMELYKKFTYGELESYRLDFVANHELGDGKLSYEDAGNLSSLYRDDFQRYTEYNAIDILCVERINNKNKFLELLYTIAYFSKVNFEDVASPVKTWDALVYNHLKGKGIAIPPMTKSEKPRKFAGAFVKDPLIVYKDWVVSVDLDGLYPHIMMLLNLGFETHVPFEELPLDLQEWRRDLFMYNFDSEGNPVVDGEGGREEWLQRCINEEIDLSLAKKYNLAFAFNGEFFSRDTPSFSNELMTEYYAMRKGEKRKMLRYEQEAVFIKSWLAGTMTAEEIESQATSNRSQGDKLEAAFLCNLSLDEYSLRKRLDAINDEVARLDGFQMAIKILLNSYYGSLGQVNSRYFDLRHAEAITMTGQANIKFIAMKLSDEINKCAKIDPSMWRLPENDRVIAIDTDSNYLDCSPLVENYEKAYKAKYNKSLTMTEKTDWLDQAFSKHFEPFIDKCYREYADYHNAYEHKMKMSREVIAYSGLWTAKKRYILNVIDSEGVRYPEPKVKYMGVDAKRSSVPEICREHLKKAYHIILNGTEKELHNFIEEFRTLHKNSEPHIIATNVTVNGMTMNRCDQNVYIKGTPSGPKGALIFNNLVRETNNEDNVDMVQEGEKAKRVLLEKANPTWENALIFPRFLDDCLGMRPYINYEEMFQNTFVKALKEMIAIRGWNEKPTNSIFDMFGGM